MQILFYEFLLNFSNMQNEGIEFEVFLRERYVDRKWREKNVGECVFEGETRKKESLKLRGEAQRTLTVGFFVHFSF